MERELIDRENFKIKFLSTIATPITNAPCIMYLIQEKIVCQNYYTI